jgi:hypothetical protein
MEPLVKCSIITSQRLSFLTVAQRRLSSNIGVLREHKLSDHCNLPKVTKLVNEE